MDETPDLGDLEMLCDLALQAADALDRGGLDIANDERELIDKVRTVSMRVYQKLRDR